MGSRRDAAETVHQIHGTGISFSSKPDDLDEKAAAALREIRQKGIDGVEVVVADAFGMDPQHLPKGFFLSRDNYWRHLFDICFSNKQNYIWRSHSSGLGYGLGHHASGYECFKKTFVYHEGNRKTNWIMVVYNLINESSIIRTDDVVLCHVFKSDNYDPRPTGVVPNLFDFDQACLNSRVDELEDLMGNPKAFKDLDEFIGRYSKCDSKWKANGRNGKRAKVWEDFTEIKVIGPDGEVMLTLAICHGCNMAYLTGKWDSEKRRVSNNGTKTLQEHKRKCSAQRHIAGNTQGAIHQMP